MGSCHLRAQWTRLRRRWAWAHRWRCWSERALNTWGWNPPPAAWCRASQRPATATASLQQACHRRAFNHHRAFVYTLNLRVFMLLLCLLLVHVAVKVSAMQQWMFNNEKRNNDIYLSRTRGPNRWSFGIFHLQHHQKKQKPHSESSGPAGAITDLCLTEQNP